VSTSIVFLSDAALVSLLATTAYAGMGLGEVFLFCSGSRHIAWLSEGQPCRLRCHLSIDLGCRAGTAGGALDPIGFGLEPRDLLSHVAALDQLGIALEDLELSLLALAPEADVELVLADAQVAYGQVW
jgi:hypothetical protein